MDTSFQHEKSSKAADGDTCPVHNKCRTWHVEITFLYNIFITIANYVKPRKFKSHSMPNVQGEITKTCQSYDSGFKAKCTC